LTKHQGRCRVSGGGKTSGGGGGGGGRESDPGGARSRGPRGGGARTWGGPALRVTRVPKLKWGPARPPRLKLARRDLVRKDPPRGGGRTRGGEREAPPSGEKTGGGGNPRNFSHPPVGQGVGPVSGPRPGRAPGAGLAGTGPPRWGDKPGRRPGGPPPVVVPGGKKGAHTRDSLPVPGGGAVGENWAPKAQGGSGGPPIGAGQTRALRLPRIGYRQGGGTSNFPKRWPLFPVQFNTTDRLKSASPRGGGFPPRP